MKQEKQGAAVKREPEKRKAALRFTAADGVPACALCGVGTKAGAAEGYGKLHGPFSMPCAPADTAESAAGEARVCFRAPVLPRRVFVHGGCFHFSSGCPSERSRGSSDWVRVLERCAEGPAEEDVRRLLEGVAKQDEDELRCSYCYGGRGGQGGGGGGGGGRRGGWGRFNR